MGATAHHPTITIRPSGLWPRVPWADFWRYRELLYFLAWRDVKVRYKQAALGAAWAILQPLAAMLNFTVIFGRLARMPSDGARYPDAWLPPGQSNVMRSPICVSLLCATRFLQRNVIVLLPGIFDRLVA